VQGVASSNLAVPTIIAGFAKAQRLTPFAGSGGAESLGGASFRFCRLFFAIPWRRVGLKRIQKTRRDRGYVIDCRHEQGFVCLRRFVEPADLSHELKRSSPNLFGSHRRIEVKKSFDISAHAYDLEVSRPESILTILRFRQDHPIDSRISDK
jgi:hypothetical protein